MSTAKPILIVASGLTMFIAFILYAVSNGLSSWWVPTQKNWVVTWLVHRESDVSHLFFRGKLVGVAPQQAGLWRACRLIYDQWVCGNLICADPTGAGASICAKMYAARTFVTLACIFSILSAICLLARLVEKIGSNRVLGLLVKGLPVLSLLMGIIGVPIGIVFIVKDAEFQIAAGSILAIVALVINLIGAVLAALAPWVETTAHSMSPFAFVLFCHSFTSRSNKIQESLSQEFFNGFLYSLRSNTSSSSYPLFSVCMLGCQRHLRKTISFGIRHDRNTSIHGSELCFFDFNRYLHCFDHGLASFIMRQDWCVSARRKASSSIDNITLKRRHTLKIPEHTPTTRLATMPADKRALIVASGLAMIIAFVFYAVSNGLASW